MGGEGSVLVGVEGSVLVGGEGSVFVGGEGSALAAGAGGGSDPLASRLASKPCRKQIQTLDLKLYN